MNNQGLMNCHRWRHDLIEFARGRMPEADQRNRIKAHLAVCRECRQFVEDQTALTVTAAKLAAGTPAAPPAGLESILAAEFVARRGFGRRHWKPAMALGAATIGAIAATLAFVALARFTPNPPRHEITPPPGPHPITAIAPVVDMPAPAKPKSLPRPVRKRAPEPAAEPEQFVAIPYTVPLDPRERATVMRMEMPVSALTAVGLTVGTPDPAASARADVVVGEDGRIHAIRLLSISDSSQKERMNQ